MDYIDNLTLTILLHLHRTHELRLHANDYDTLEQLQVYISWIEALLKNKPANLSIEDDELFEENYKPCITYKTFITDIVIRCEDIGRLETYLIEYIRACINEDLKEYGNKNEYDSITSLSEELKTIAESSNKSKRRHIVIGVKYTPVVAEKYLQHNNFIRDMEIELVSPELIEYPIKMYLYTDSGDIESVNPDWQEYFACQFELDMAWYIEEHNKSISKTITKKRRKMFAPLQNKLYRYLYNNAKEGVFMLSRTDLKNCITLTSKDKTLNDLRNQYREIFHKLSDFNIISYNRSTKLYDIHKDILTDKIE